METGREELYSELRSEIAQVNGPRQNRHGPSSGWSGGKPPTKQEFGGQS